ncbi:hypothetical protein H0H93_009878 [Arthromyces matolae]|nr:hypothetical protein H0H93_009878 [Arthromyces matolae]
MKFDGLRPQVKRKKELSPREAEELEILQHFRPYYLAARQQNQLSLFLDALVAIWQDRLLPDPANTMTDPQLKNYFRRKLIWLCFQEGKTTQLTANEAREWKYYVSLEVDRRFRVRIFFILALETSRLILEHQRMQYFMAARLGRVLKNHQYTALISRDVQAIVEKIRILPSRVIDVVVTHLEAQLALQ